ncbi:rRNA maturation RNase YbeY [Oceanibium sediminis]|uniref:rRNA maturation RNase YbeY n=1 Tax=Oceanibium sediminis TaxID=2026339 RepID=UPI000DD3D7BF|nr:rRNA maturation RNase YbeY [Oceanibium sediminis]
MTEIIDLVVEDPRWDETGLQKIAEQAAELALEAAGIETRAVEIGLLACDDATIATLNSRFRGKSSATNVLSWPALDLFPQHPGAAPDRLIPASPFGATSLGDVAIAYETVTKEARERGIPVDLHSLHLILHGCLHLLGYDHETESDAALMEGIEIRALASVGVASPYAESEDND